MSRHFHIQFNTHHSLQNSAEDVGVRRALGGMSPGGHHVPTGSLSPVWSPDAWVFNWMLQRCLFVTNEDIHPEKRAYRRDPGFTGISQLLFVLAWK